MNGHGHLSHKSTTCSLLTLWSVFAARFLLLSLVEFAVVWISEMVGKDLEIISISSGEDTVSLAHDELPIKSSVNLHTVDSNFNPHNMVLTTNVRTI